MSVEHKESGRKRDRETTDPLDFLLDDGFMVNLGDDTIDFPMNYDWFNVYSYNWSAKW